MHTSNFESAALPSNLRQDGVYMTNDRIPYAKKSTLPRRFLSLVSPLALSLPLFCSFRRRALTSDILITRRAPLPFSLFLSHASSRIPSDIMSARIMETDGWYMETSNVTARGAVWKRSPFQFANSRCHGRKESGALPFLIKILKWQSIKRIDIERAPVETLCHRFILIL